MATHVQTARRSAARLGVPNWEDTGVALTVRLATDPVILREAEAVLVFLRRCVDAAVAVCQDQHEDIELVPVVEVRNGSLEAIVRFFYRKKPKKKAKRKSKTEGILDGALKEGAKEFAKQVAIVLVTALAVWSGFKSPPPPAEPPAPPGFVKVVSKEVKPALNDLRDVLDATGKPWTLRVEQPGGRQVTLEPRRPPPPSGNFDL